MAVTSLEVARLAGFSQPTVSQVLNGKGERYSDATCKAIRDAASQLGYRPNAAARAIRSQTSSTVALIVGTHPGRSTLPTPMLRGIQLALKAQDMSLMLVSLDDDALGDADQLPRILREVLCDGLLIAYTHGLPQSMLDAIKRYHIPAVWINTHLDTNCVRPDDYNAGRQAVEHLIRLGHEKILYLNFNAGVDGEHDHYSVSHRLAGYRDGMRHADLEPIWLPGDKRGFVPWELRLPMSRQILAGPDRPTAVVAYSDSSSVPMCVAAAERGMRLPEDLRFVDFANECHQLPPFADHMVVPSQQVGLEAASRLFELIKQPGTFETLTIPFTLRQTVFPDSSVSS